MTDPWWLAPALALAAGLLALAPLGVQVLGRGVVFIDLAVAQAAAAAALGALALGGHPPWPIVQSAAVIGSLAAAGLVAWMTRAWQQHREALVGLVYVAGACLALLAARLDVHGAEHLHALLAADVLWAGWAEATTLAVCALIVVAVGAARLARDAWFYPTFAITAAVTVQVLGLFVVFAALIAPGLWQRAGLGRMPAAAVGVAAAGSGLAASWWLDAPSGVLVALLLALAGGAAAIPALRRIAAGGARAQAPAPKGMP